MYILTRKNQSAALLSAIKEYDANKWKVIGNKVGKPAKVGFFTMSRVRYVVERNPANWY
jgi:hypothetical protein